MKTIEFETSIENGIIFLPPKYKNIKFKNTKITLSLLEDLEDSIKNIEKKEKLLVAFKELQEANPFKEIINPINWQKQQRDEWGKSIVGQ